jgi:Domain of unknown function (DUF5655)
MPNARSWQEMRVQIEDQLRRETGQDVAAWNARVGEQPGLDSEADLRRWLDAQDVRGYPQMILVFERFGYPDYLLASSDELIDGQYRDREALRPIFERLVAEAASLGTVELQARKGYATLIGPRRTFASIEPSTKTRVDLGLRLEGIEPEGRLEPAKGIGQSSMTHMIALTSPDAVDAEVLGWLRRAYDANA